MVKPKFFKKTLNNGMTVIFEQRKKAGVVSVAFAVKHGGVNEPKEEKGISHFIEHMLFKGTKNRTSKKISEDIEKKGGVLNGFTDEELTVFYCKMPSEHIFVALDVLSDMIKNPLFDESEMNKERQVIFEEIKMRKDNPQLLVYDKIQSLLYTGNLSMEAIGTEESMNSIDKNKITKKFNEVYTTNNIILCVVGDCNFDYLCDFCEKNFEKTFNIISEPEIGLKNEEFTQKRTGIDQASMIFAFHSPKADDPEIYASQVLATLMAGGMSSRLWQEIREKRNLAYAVKGSCNIAKRFAFNTIYIGTSSQNLNEVKNLILQEFDKIKNLDEKELEEVKQQIIGNNKISKEDSQGQMLDLLYHEVQGDASKSYLFEKKIKKVKIKEVKDLANLKNYSIFTLVPE